MDNLIKTLLLLTLIVGLGACNRNDAQDEFEQKAFQPADGITQTDFNSNIVGDPDPDDWRTSPFYTGLADIEPSYPNPIQFGTNARLDVFLNGIPYTTVLELGYFDTRLSDSPWIQIDLYQDATEFSTPSLNINTDFFGNTVDEARGTYRLVLFDSNQRVITYGDIRIE